MRSLNNYEDTHRHTPRESEYVKTSNAKFEQLRGYPQAYAEEIRVYKNKPSAVRINTRIHADLSSFDDKSSERFEPRQTAVCRLNMQVPPRKLKPPQMRRFEFSGRGERIRTFDTLVPNQVLYQTELHPETNNIITTFFLNANFFLNFILV